MKIGKTKGKTIVIDLGLVGAILIVGILVLFIDFAVIHFAWKFFNLP